MKIQILGSGCTKCTLLGERAREAVTELGLQADIVKVTDMDKVLDMGSAPRRGSLVRGLPDARRVRQGHVLLCLVPAMSIAGAILAIVMSATVFGWRLGLARVVGAVVFSVIIGLIRGAALILDSGQK